MLTLIPTLREFFKSQRLVYVGGNLLMVYQRGSKRKHVSPDLFVVRGVGNHLRENFLIWEEGKAPELVIEFTSRSTRKEDLQTNYALYRDVLKVKEYFLFDPNAEYLKPPLQGHRLRGGKYLAIRGVEGRLPSRVLGLHLERAGSDLRLWDPATGQWLLTPAETRQQADEARQQADEARQQAEAEARREAAARRQAEAEVERLRREIEQLRRR
jgi:Uma2 family endonuclease